jgi:hypothetical protein
LRPDEQRLRAVFNRIERYIEHRYGVPVRIRDVPDPFTGDLDGEEIHVDYAEDLESAVFIIAHLFGHTVQMNTDEKARELGYAEIRNPGPELLERLRTYELEACRYAMQLFHDAGVTDLDQWMSDYAACDFAYLAHFYATGQKAPFKGFWKDGAPLLTPKPIPKFEPTRWVWRSTGIVV